MMMFDFGMAHFGTNTINKSIRVLILIAFFSVTSLGLFSQTFRFGDSVAISFVRLDGTLLDARQPNLILVLKNVANRPIYIYNQLVRGDADSRFSNVYIDLEKKAGAKYRYVSTGYYKNSHELDFSDSLRYYDVSKSLIAPRQCDTLPIKLFGPIATFEPGSYRVKINLRIGVIRDKKEYHYDPTGASAPPDDRVQYVSSAWIYFKMKS